MFSTAHYVIGPFMKSGKDIGVIISGCLDIYKSTAYPASVQATRCFIHPHANPSAQSAQCHAFQHKPHS